MLKKARTRFVPVVLISGAVMVGCTSNHSERVEQTPTERAESSTSTASSESPSQSTGAGSQSDASASPPSPAEGDITALDVIEIALAQVPGTAVVEVDLHGGSGVPQWEIVVVDDGGNGTELRIDASSGAVISQAPVPLDLEERVPPKVSAQAVISIVAELASGPIVQLELDGEDGRLIWEVDARESNSQIRQFDVDASTGEVIRSKVD